MTAPHPAERIRGALGSTAAAQLPPAGLDGLDPAWSRLVDAPDAQGVPRRWHLLDTGEALGTEPVGTVLCVHGNPTWSYLWRRLAAATLDKSRVPVTYPHLGNVGPASIPITLAEEQKTLKNGDRVLLMGVGSGLNTALMEIAW